MDLKFRSSIPLFGKDVDKNNLFLSWHLLVAGGPKRLAKQPKTANLMFGAKSQLAEDTKLKMGFRSTRATLRVAIKTSLTEQDVLLNRLIRLLVIEALGFFLRLRRRP